MGCACRSGFVSIATNTGVLVACRLPPTSAAGDGATSMQAQARGLFFAWMAAGRFGSAGDAQSLQGPRSSSVDWGGPSVSLAFHPTLPRLLWSDGINIHVFEVGQEET